MTGPHSLRFACPQCMARLTARKRRAGTKGRCPWCQFVFTVPSESRLPGQHETYGLQSGDQRPEEGPEPVYVAVSCPVCQTRLSAPEEQVGQKIECPDCGTAVTVVRPPPKARPTQPAPASPEDIYPVWQGEGQPPPTVRAVHQRYIPVICGACRTRMLATEEQVGEKLICPDCGMTTAVPPPAERRPAAGPTADDGVYGLCEGEGQPGADSVAWKEHFAFKCPRCLTRLQATAEQAGREIDCPDCATRLTIPQPPVRRPAAEPEEPIETYGVGAPAERPPLEVYGLGAPVDRPPVETPPVEPPADRLPAQPPEPPRERPGARLDDRPPGWVPSEHTRPKLPKHPFVSGIYGFLFYPRVWVCWLWMAAGLAVVLRLVAGAIQLAAVPNPASYFVAMSLGVAAGLIGLGWFAASSANLLAILNDSAEGSDRIENWPEAVFLDWFLHGINVVVAAGMATVTGVGVDWVVAAAGGPRGPGLAAGVFLTFPFFLLSVLETGLPFLPVSLPVVRSLGQAWLAWLCFYLHTALLVPVAGAALLLPLKVAGLWAIFLATAVFAAVLLLYFRLLGRLAWCSADRLAERDAEEEETDQAPAGESNPIE